LKGFRDANTKAFLIEDGEIVQLIANEPVHYMDSYGVWHDIDANVKATANGYEVSENTFFTAFAPEAGGGVIVQPNEFVDPIVTGIAPMLITLDEAGIAPTPYDAGEATGGVTVSGNSIRYSIGQGFDLDYLVSKPRSSKSSSFERSLTSWKVKSGSVLQKVSDYQQATLSSPVMSR